MSEEIKTTEEQPNLFGKVDDLRNVLELEMTIITEDIDKSLASISRLGIKVGALKKRKKALYAMVKAVKDREIVLGEGEPQEETEDEVFQDHGEEPVAGSL